MSYDDVLGPIGRMAPAAEVLGDDMVQVTKALTGAFQAQADFLAAFAASSCQAGDAECMKLLEPTGAAISGLSDLRDKLKRSAFHQHITVAVEGSQALSWVTVKPAPVPFINEALDQMMFYGNKVMMANKGKEPEHAAWVKA
eukprot:PhM_4_TR19112/c0_g2_i1/m.81058/K17261/CAP1_2, SRV2; adenylyl cyclase-associated protein